jgi:uncharacterized SAM-binding protein YcdF (DUF218 family)
MEKEQAVTLIWDYMHMGHTLRPADVIFVLGSNDVRVGTHAAELYHRGLAPLIAISGDGTKHETALLKDTHGGRTEASVLTEICLKAGVPASALITEDKANNTGQNFEFMTPILTAHGITPKTAIVVQKPYMERRAYATGKIWWPDVELILTSPAGTFTEYTKDAFDPDTIINIMQGDL